MRLGWWSAPTIQPAGAGATWRPIPRTAGTLRMVRTSDRLTAQTRENVLAVLRWRALPAPPVVATLTDRVLFAPTADFRDRMLACAAAGTFRPWPFLTLHGTTAIRSWREDVPFASLQVVEHRELLEVDIDLCNPDSGLLAALGHLVEVAWPGKTDPFRARKWIMRRGIAVPLVG